jgi:heme-degrading monooxygenase HmoA
MAEAAAAQLDGLSAAPVERYFFRPWVAYQVPGTRAVAIEAAVLRYTTQQAETVHLFILRDATRRLRNTPGFCYRQVFRDVDAANRLLIVLGWDSSVALERFRRDVRPTFEERQPPTGVSMDHFVGILDIDLQRADDPPAS